MSLGYSVLFKLRRRAPEHTPSGICLEHGDSCLQKIDDFFNCVLGIGGARHLGPSDPSGPLGISIEFLSVGRLAVQERFVS